MELNFEIADRFFRDFLEKTSGIKTKDQKRREQKSKGSQPFEKGRDPVMAKDSMSSLIASFSWQAPLSKAELFSNWSAMVGEDIALASQPESLEAGVLIIRCRSTAWATQLRGLQEEVLSKISESFPELEITELRFLGPNAPSWKKGPRSIPGRGPRDTYG